MEKQVMLVNIDRIARQRNLLLALLIMSVVSLVCLSFRVATTNERTILVPGLSREVWTSERGVGVSYLEESAAMYLPLLLDLTSDSINWKKELLMSHVSQSDERYMRLMNEYFSSAQEKYKKFSLSTHFAVKSFEVDQKALIVKAKGQLMSRFGQRGIETMEAIYVLSFEWISGKLLLKEFVKLEEEDG